MRCQTAPTKKEQKLETNSKLLRAAALEKGKGQIDHKKFNNARAGLQRNGEAVLGKRKKKPKNVLHKQRASMMTGGKLTPSSFP